MAGDAWPAGKGSGNSGCGGTIGGDDDIRNRGSGMAVVTETETVAVTVVETERQQ